MKGVAEDGKKDERPKERNSMQADKVSAPAEAGSKIGKVVHLIPVNILDFISVISGERKSL